MASMVKDGLRGIRLLLLALALASVPPAVAMEASRRAAPGSVLHPMMLTTSAALSGQADFRGEVASPEVRQVADRVLAIGDNGGLPFIIIDKIQAKVFVFNSTGRLRGATPALLGEARGDHTVPGIGSRKLSTIAKAERTTPAGRFVAFLGRDFEQDILWIDYDSALSLHRVIKGARGDHRSQRLATVSPLDNRISYGCVNVPARFYDEVVVRTFVGTRGIVYILPETKNIRDMFPAPDDAAGTLGSDTGQDSQTRGNGT